MAMCAALALAMGCGDSTDTGPGGDGADAAVQPDADVPSTTNVLGQACTGDGDCPSQHGCVFLTAGNPALGYCSPVCLSDEDCRANYTGPATGSPTCFVPDQPERCSITCGSTEDCPLELVCIVTGGPVNICATE